MPFDRAFFEKIGELLSEYFKVYRCGMVTVTVKACGQEYNVVRILRCDERLLTFAFYEPEKSRELSPITQEKTGETKAWPALSLPYEAIEFVEFNPGKAGSPLEIGFKAEGNA